MKSALGRKTRGCVDEVSAACHAKGVVLSGLEELPCCHKLVGLIVTARAALSRASRID